MKIRWLLVSFVTMAGIVTGVQAMERFEIVTTQEFRQIMAKRDAVEMDLMLVDSLDAMIYAHHHFPG